MSDIMSSARLGQLHVRHQYYLGVQGAPESFAWFSASGIYHGNVRANAERADGLVDGAQVFPYVNRVCVHSCACDIPYNAVHYSYLATSTPSSPVDQQHLETPIAIGSTQFHFLLLSTDRIRAVCKLNGEMVWEAPVPEVAGYVNFHLRSSVIHYAVP